MKRCGGRKEKGCNLASDICSWDGTKCNNKKVTKETKVKEVKNKSVRCKGRKEKGCNDAIAVCTWNGPLQSCDNKPATIRPMVTVKKPVVVLTRCKGRKEKGCLSVPSLCKWDGQVCTTKVKTVKSVKSVVAPVKVKSTVVKVKSSKKESVKVVSKTPEIVKTAPKTPEKIMAIPQRHCMYYGKSVELLHKTKVNMTSCLKEKYDPAFKSKTNVHLGQRKLMLSEIQLLLEFYKKNTGHPTVVYIGAAPGSHLLHLSEMFPRVRFILFDGATFDKRLHAWPNVFNVHEGSKGFFTSDKCKDLKAYLTRSKIQNIIFVSDIRLGNENKEMFEKDVMRDMDLQKEWVEIIKPKLALLKFRMSYSMKHGDHLEYLKGDILYGIWPKQQSGETRLLVHEKDMNNVIKYDFKSYEESMFFHNKYVRPFCFTSKYEKYSQVYCPCYDCLSELKILDAYAKLTKVKLDDVVAVFGKNMNTSRRANFLTANHNIINEKLVKLDSVIGSKCVA